MRENSNYDNSLSTYEPEEEDFSVYGDGVYPRYTVPDSTPISQEYVERKPYTTNIEEDQDTTSLVVKPSSKIDEVVVQTPNFSMLDDHKLDVVDVYEDIRAFLTKTDTSKFVVVMFILIMCPILLAVHLIDATIFRDMMILISAGYLGIEAYDRRTIIKHSRGQ